MTIKVTMPQMGESVYEGTLTKWLKKVGDHVRRDEPLFEISTDKVDSEIPSPATGILDEILVKEGETIQINTTLAVIREDEESRATGGTQEAVQGDETGQTAGAIQPQEEAGEPERTLPEKAAGDKRTKEAAPVSEVRIQSMPEAPTIPAPGTKEAPKRADDVRLWSIRTSPLVRKIARENDVDLSQVPGTGLGGRITRDDILKFIEGQTGAGNRSPSGGGVPGTPAGSSGESGESVKEYGLADTLRRFTGETETVPMTPMRKAIAEHMVLSKRTSPHVNTVFEVDLESIARLRDRYREEFEKRENVALTYTPFFAKALIDTVREYPVLNSSLIDNAIVYKKPINLGIAVALEQGLIVPVIKNAQLKSLTGIALKIADLASRARAKKLKPEEVQDGTISLTNPGRYGALFSTPIINQPQVAILGVGGVEKRPVVMNDAIAIRTMVCLSLSFDHRVIDGAVADRFMAALKTRLESWDEWID
jgi:pyruvate dehydrogenase E2 component (dihydrolipoamide acetyltransferase)